MDKNVERYNLQEPWPSGLVWVQSFSMQHEWKFLKGRCIYNWAGGGNWTWAIHSTLPSVYSDAEAMCQTRCHLVSTMQQNCCITATIIQRRRIMFVFLCSEFGAPQIFYVIISVTSLRSCSFYLLVFRHCFIWYQTLLKFVLYIDICIIFTVVIDPKFHCNPITWCIYKGISASSLC